MYVNQNHKFSLEEVKSFNDEVSSIIEKISAKLLSLTFESAEPIDTEILTLALMQIAAALAIQTSCPKDIFLRISELEYNKATKFEIQDIYNDIGLLKSKIETSLN